LKVEILNPEVLENLYKNHGEFACTCYDTPKKFADKVGKWLPLGIAQGFENAMPETERSMRDSVMGAVNTLKTDLSGANLQLANAVSGNASVTGVGGVVGNTQQVVNFYQTNNSPKALDRLTVYRETNSLLFNAKVRLSNV